MSDTENDVIPAYHIDKSKLEEVGQHIRSLYHDVVLVFGLQSELTLEEVMEQVARNWMANKSRPFMLLVEFWCASTTPVPDIWQATTTETVIGPGAKQTKPMHEIDLVTQDFTGGRSFFACFSRGYISEEELNLLHEMRHAREGHTTTSAG